MAINIEISYQLAGDSEWSRVQLTPDEFFDLDEDEAADVEASCPKYNHTMEYLPDISALNVQRTMLRVEDTTSGKLSTIAETFWSNGENRIVERTSSFDPPGEDWEMIVSVLVTKDPHVTEILRFGRMTGIVKVFSHVFIETLPDETEISCEVDVS